MSVILGPCLCHKCRRLVTWDGWEWHNSMRFPHEPTAHVCRPERNVDKSLDTGLARDATMPPESKRPGKQPPAGPPTISGEPYSTRQCITAQDAELHIFPPLARRAGWRCKQRRWPALPRPRETRPVAERPGAVGHGVTADLGPPTVRAERTPRRTADASTPPSGNGGRVPRYRSAYGSASQVTR